MEMVDAATPGKKAVSCLSTLKLYGFKLFSRLVTVVANLIVCLCC